MLKLLDNVLIWRSCQFILVEIHLISQKQWIKQALGVKEVDRFDTYLGLPTLVGQAKYQTFAYLKEQVWKKL